jgi:hypothetical protein
LLEGAPLHHAVIFTTLLRDLPLAQGTLLRGLLVGARRHGLALVVTTSGDILLAVPKGLALRGALLCNLLLAVALLVELARTHVLSVLHLLLASCLRLLGDLLTLSGLLGCDALHDGLALLGTAVDGFTALRGSLLCTLRRFATHGSLLTHGGLLTRLASLGGRSTLLAGPGLRLCFFRLLLTAVLLVVTPRVLLRAGCCNGAQGQDGADHDGQHVSTCGIQVHGDPLSGHGQATPASACTTRPRHLTSYEHAEVVQPA